MVELCWWWLIARIKIENQNQESKSKIKTKIDGGQVDESPGGSVKGRLGVSLRWAERNSSPSPCLWFVGGTGFPDARLSSTPGRCGGTCSPTGDNRRQSSRACRSASGAGMAPDSVRMGIFRVSPGVAISRLVRTRVS